MCICVCRCAQVYICVHLHECVCVRVEVHLCHSSGLESEEEFQESLGSIHCAQWSLLSCWLISVLEWKICTWVKRRAEEENRAGPFGWWVEDRSWRHMKCSGEAKWASSALTQQVAVTAGQRVQPRLSAERCVRGGGFSYLGACLLSTTRVELPLTGSSLHQLVSVLPKTIFLETEILTAISFSQRRMAETFQAYKTYKQTPSRDPLNCLTPWKLVALKIKFSKEKKMSWDHFWQSTEAFRCGYNGPVCAKTMHHLRRSASMNQCPLTQATAILASLAVEL